MRKAKNYFYALASLVLFLPAIVSARWDPNNPDYLAANLPRGSVYEIVYTFMLWILGIFGFLGIIGFAISGIMYLTSAGNEQQVEKAKKAMNYSLIGVVVGLAGLVILIAVDKLLRQYNYF